MKDFNDFLQHQQKLDIIENSSCDDDHASCDPAIKLVGMGKFRMEGEPLTPRRGSVVGVIRSVMKDDSMVRVM